MINTEVVRNASAETPVALTSVVKNSVKNVKLKTNPVTTPSGFFLPPVSVPDNTMGSTGRIHGESIVTMPPKKANTISKTMFLLDISDQLINAAAVPLCDHGTGVIYLDIGVLIGDDVLLLEL